MKKLPHITLLACLFAMSNTALADHYYDDNPYYRGGYDRDRWENDREGDAMQRERERLQMERDQFNAQRSGVHSKVNERCPAGFSQSENKCSSEERRRGCKDIRLDNGIGCVKR